MNETIQWIFILSEAAIILYFFIRERKKLAEEKARREKMADPWQSLLDENGNQIAIPGVYTWVNPETGETETCDPFNLLETQEHPKGKGTH